ncbi:hypothetical protein KBD49_12525 [Myxococcota bacterium]|jgi:hypothetical protein|nr:hypothetical protein [Myxococcota bacterium]
MNRVALSVIGDLWVLHPDDPPETEVRRRLALLLRAPLPSRGLVRILPGGGFDEVLWQAFPQAGWGAAHRPDRAPRSEPRPEGRRKTDF